MKTEILKAPDISCDHCAESIQKALAPLPGILRVEVDLDQQEVQVDFEESKVDLGRIEGILALEGYPVRKEAVESGVTAVERRTGHGCCGSCHL